MSKARRKSAPRAKKSARMRGQIASCPTTRLAPRPNLAKEAKAMETPRLALKESRPKRALPKAKRAPKKRSTARLAQRLKRTARQAQKTNSTARQAPKISLTVGPAQKTDSTARQ